jgi:hypothetical protein
MMIRGLPGERLDEIEVGCWGVQFRSQLDSRVQDFHRLTRTGERLLLLLLLMLMLRLMLLLWL